MSKKILVVFVALIFLAGSLSALYGSSKEDLAAIKKAVKSKKKGNDLTFFKILVTDTRTNKVKVRITLPISLVEMLADCTEGKMNLRDRCHLDLKKILKELKKGGALTFVEVCDDKETVKIWFE
jgi:hypothetical protein